MAVPDVCSSGGQVAHNLVVPKAPKNVTALDRLTALRQLSLLNTEELSPGQVCC